MYTATGKLTRDGCETVGNVTYTYCAGGCGDSMNMPMLMPSGSNYDESSNKNCKCCTGTIAAFDTVNVKCEGIDSVLTAMIPRFNKCECNSCANTGMK